MKDNYINEHTYYNVPALNILAGPAAPTHKDECGIRFVRKHPFTRS